MINKKIITNGGFTLLETLVAILVLTIAITGPLTIASKGLQSTLIAKDQDTAFYLAEDAIEYVRWIRDTNKLSGGNWLTGAGDTPSSNARSLTPCESSAGCYLDSTENSPVMPTDCTPTVTCPVMDYDPSVNRYSYTSGTQTLFTRTTQLTVVNTNEATLTVTVTWCDQASVCATTPRLVVVREELFNWQ